MKIEICATNIQSALAAQRGGAHRIELCTALDLGGLTPSPGLIYAAVHQLQIPVNVLIRPREGNFTYTRAELQVMLDDIGFCHDAEAHGVVVGALDAHGHFDLPLLEALAAAAEGLELVCHRAFDFVRDPFAALEALIEMGFRRVLTSGHASSAFEGRELLRKLVERAAGRIEIMPGAGISAGNLHALAEATGAETFHLSGRRRVEQGGNLAISGLETGYWESDEASIRALFA